VVIKAAVKSLEGVSEVEADHTREWARVLYNKEKVKAGDIFKKLQDNGFEPSVWKEEKQKP
jgi:copper chaperone CopZ